jgi:hypothetical protein
MDINDLRISKLRMYLIENVINVILKNENYQINTNMLSNDINNYSLDKIPTDPETERWVIGIKKMKDVYSLRSRMAYGSEVITNLKSMGFFEQFENTIKYNNENHILPDIDNIESIECLNPGTMSMNSDGKTAEFEIQIQIIYRKDKEKIIVSL